MRLRVRPVRTPGRYRQDRRTFRSTPHTPDRPGTGHRHSDTALRSERAAEKKRRGSHKQPLWNRFRFRDNRRNVRNIPPRAIAMQDSRMFGRMPLQAFPSGQPDLQPFRNKTRNGPSAAGIMSRRRNETEKGKRPDRSRERTALEIRRIRTKKGALHRCKAP